MDEPSPSCADIDPMGLPDLVELKEQVLLKSHSKGTTKSQLSKWWRGCIAVHRSRYDGMAYMPSHKHAHLLWHLYHNSQWSLPYFLKAIDATTQYWDEWRGAAGRPMPQVPDIAKIYNDSTTWYEWILKNVSRDVAGP